MKKITNYKTQITNKLQVPISNDQTKILFSFFGFLYWSLFVVWSVSFGAFYCEEV